MHRTNRILSLIVTALLLSSAVAHAAGTGLGVVYGSPTAPALVAETREGVAYDLGTKRGRVVLVNFWATWCPPCRAEMPALEALRSRFEGRPFDIVAVHMGPGAEHIDTFLGEMDPPLQFTFINDELAEIGRDWGVKGLPMTWIVDTRGRQYYEAFGEREWAHDDIAALVTRLLDAPKEN